MLQPWSVKLDRCKTLENTNIYKQLMGNDGEHSSIPEFDRLVITKNTTLM